MGPPAFQGIKNREIAPPDAEYELFRSQSLY
jgi:hypothetical protein